LSTKGRSIVLNAIADHLLAVTPVVSIGQENSGLGTAKSSLVYEATARAEPSTCTGVQHRVRQAVKP
jgi:hypothetical protein